MNWYYVDAGKQAGPVDDTELEELARSGKIVAETLVWREGMSNWQPYREARPAGTSIASTPGTPALGPNEAVCAECGKIFNTQDMIAYGGVRVCAACKPVFVQKLAEGVPVSHVRGKRSLPVDPDALIAEVLARDYQVDIGGCLSRGWDLVKSHFGISVGATLLVMVCIQASGFIPFAGAILAIMFQGPLLGGLNLFFLKLVRGEPAGIGDAFAGFSRGFWRLCGTFVLMALLLYAWFIPALVTGIVWAVRKGPVSGGMPGAPFWALLALGFVGLVWLAISFVFALPLCADLELRPWAALKTSFLVVSKHWFAVFGLLVVVGFLSMLGLVACFIGVFITMPILYAATLYAYEDIFGARS